jgi:biotin carboxyl carrier protein
MDALDRLDEVFETLPKVRKDLGMIPLVTPTSQIVGIQTVNNVLFDSKLGEYARITEQVKDLCYGLYGQTTLPINSEVCAKALKGYPRGEKPITVRPGDILEPEMPGVIEQSKGLAKDIDDELIVALYPVTGPRFLKWKYGLEEAPAETKPVTMEQIQQQNELIEKAKGGLLVEKSEKVAPPKSENLRSFDVYVDGEYFKVEINTQGMPVATAQPVVAAKPVSKPVATPTPSAVKTEPVKSEPVSQPSAAAEAGDVTIQAPMPGMIISYEKQVGDTVKYGETVLVLEAMKMYNNIAAPADGVVKAIPFKSGDSVGKGNVLMIVTPK